MTGHPRAHRSRGSLLLIATAQFVLVLDITIVTVAFPSIQSDLGVRTGQLQWLVTAYALTFGGFLLLGGAASDVWGRRRMFALGMLGYAASSLAAGLAVNAVVLVAARAGEGLAAAFISPAALSLLTTTFPEGCARNRALAVFGAVASAGGASGLLLGGVLSELVGWRAVFLVNVPLAAAAAFAAPRILTGQRDETPRRLDGAGAATITLALLTLVLGLDRAGTAGFASPSAVVPIAIAGALMLAFVALERRARSPLVPPALLRLPTLVGTDLASFSVSALVTSMPFFLSLYMQSVLALSPAETGFAFLPMSLAIMAVSAVAARVALRVGPRRLLFAGLGALAAAAVMLSRLPAHGSYAYDVLPATLLFAVGLGVSYTATTIGGTAHVSNADQGAAAGLLDTFNQIGGAVGLAVLATVTAGAEGAVGGASVAALQTAFLAALAFVAFGTASAALLIHGVPVREVQAPPTS